MRRHKIPLLVAALCLAAAIPLHAAPATLTVDVDQPGHPISPMLYGIFFEDINCSADGGLYAELVRNRSFEESGPGAPVHWLAVSNGQAAVQMEVAVGHPESVNNRQALKVTIGNPGNGRGGVANNGYWGISLAKGAQYDLSLLARGEDGFRGPLAASLESPNGQVYARQRIPSLSGDWKQYKLSLKSVCHRRPRPPRYQHHPPGRLLAGHGLPLPQQDLEGPPQRPAPRPGRNARRPQARLRPLPRRLLGRGRQDERGLPLEAHHWRRGRAPFPAQPVELQGYPRPRLPRIPATVRRPRRRTALRHQLRHGAQGQRAAGPDAGVRAGRAGRH